MIVTIGGPPGSGKTTVARMLAEKLKLELVIIGELFRAQAREQGQTLGEFGETAAKDHSIDLSIDKRTVELARKGDMILEGRLAGVMMRTHKIPSFKIWLEASLEERARRIAEREHEDPKDIVERIRGREQCERERYRAIYDIEYDNREIYDLVIDTSNIAPDEILALILDHLKV
ncbi:MAG: AAA family ATPase [Thermoplasmata archaeon]|nr:MAG: AAA family ATPase [Thermoplasmata archaeon]